MTASPPSAAELHDVFEGVVPGTVGIEEEVMLLDPGTLALTPRAVEVLDRLGTDPRFKLELPAAQLEIALGPAPGVSELAVELLAARRELVEHAAGLAVPASAGVHPFSAGIGELNRAPQYAHTISEYGPVARRQLVFALQVHVAVGGAARTLAVYNALRGYLPLLAALAANAPFYEGRDSGLASVRPKLAELLPRQGVPPPLESWEEYAQALRWGVRAGTVADAGRWWWELRPHPGFGTLELRVPDAQVTVTDSAAVAAVAYALVLWLSERHDRGEALPVAPTWRIEENRWSACRHGAHGLMADLDSGAARPTAEWLHELIDAVAPLADAGSAGLLEHARRLIDEGGAALQRRAAGTRGARAAAAYLVLRFLDPFRG